MMLLRDRTVLSALSLLLSITQSSAQTYSKCNPLTEDGCSADPALGKSVTIDFTSGASSQFTASGDPTYGSDGAEFTVAKHGDSPTITSSWYIMFGHVEYVIQAAPGTGIVSSAVLQSDCLDEIDWEWLGGDNDQAQSNYFGKGITTTYNRGAFHGADNNHGEFHTYSVDWTAEQIVWGIDGQTVRVLTQADAATGQYPQTPMQVKVGTWAGGDPSNAQGTINWAGGLVDYSAGPFTMYLKSISVKDYSTGSSYSYSGTSGTWESIESDGGKVNGGSGSSTPATTVASSAASTVTSSVSDNAPLAFGAGDSSGTATRTGWPWDATATVGIATTVLTSATGASTSISGLPSGWTISESGKAVPPSSGSTVLPSPSSAPASSSASSLASGLEISTSYDNQGFPTVVTINPAAPTQPKSYNSQGFLITTSTASTTPAIATAEPTTSLTTATSEASGVSSSLTSANSPTTMSSYPSFTSSQSSHGQTSPSSTSLHSSTSPSTTLHPSASSLSSSGQTSHSSTTLHSSTSPSTTLHPSASSLSSSGQTSHSSTTLHSSTIPSTRSGSSTSSSTRNASSTHGTSTATSPSTEATPGSTGEPAAVPNAGSGKGSSFALLFIGMGAVLVG